MPLFQPSVPQLPTGIDLSGKTIIVTGATAGIGLEICRQMLAYNVSDLIMAVRNVSKGEAVKRTLLSETTTTAATNIHVMELDTEDYSSVKKFTSAFQAKFRKLHLLMANAGIGTISKQFAVSGHEKTFQVNYLSNVLLTLGLLPLLEATAAEEVSATRVTWTGSRMYPRSTLAGKAPLERNQRVFDYFNKAEGIPEMLRYSNSKLLCVLFQLELAERYAPEKVVINSFCPGMVNTGMSDILPFYLRIPVDVFKAIRARSPEQAGRIALNAGVLASANTHGKLLLDMEVEKHWEFIDGGEGRRVRKMLWNETIDEMASLVDVPGWMKHMA